MWQGSTSWEKLPHEARGEGRHAHPLEYVTVLRHASGFLTTAIAAREPKNDSRRRLGFRSVHPAEASVHRGDGARSRTIVYRQLDL